MTPEQEVIFNINMSISNLEREVSNTKRCMVYSMVVFLLMSLSSYITLNSDVITRLSMVVLVLNGLVMFLSIKEAVNNYGKYKAHNIEIDSLSRSK